ncbi:Fic family protein [Nesterenkonia pannonica]|uniref:Fic family protein n=1 Tax=Nesterenkonia pannonica TaxID=1548602 RepID=UPI002164471F|nr:Fic family protein [Nesterenkonia pannonica]
MATVEDYARALHGVKSNESAVSMAQATGAINHLVQNGPTEEAVLQAHSELMRHDRTESLYAGRWRDVQNWIGGSDYSPRGADYVPPPPDHVEGLVEDLFAFSCRDDIPVLVQASIAHAQLEAIHPFTDGNGRIGRALASAIMRRRGSTEHVTVPVAAALYAKRDEYFGALNEYHGGDAEPIIRLFSLSARVAADESSTTAQLLRLLPDLWRKEMGGPRSGSAMDVVLARMERNPVFTDADLEDDLGLSDSSAHRVVAALRDAGLIRALTERKRNRVWAASEVLDELGDLELRIGARMKGR